MGDDTGLLKRICKKYGIKPKGKKFPSDPHKPKKALTAYLAFGNDVRSTIRDENKGASVTEILQMIGKRWKEVSDTEKAKYEKIAADGKIRENRFSQELRRGEERMEQNEEEKAKLKCG